MGLRRPERRNSRSSAVRRVGRLRLERLEERCLLASGPAAYGQLPLAFEPNAGQAAAGVDFVAHGPGYALSLSSANAALALHHQGGADLIAMSLVNRRSTEAVGQDRLPGVSNYLIGTDPTDWRTDIPTYAGVSYAGVYPGVDLVYYGNQGRLEYDFTVRPGADPAAIQLHFSGIVGLGLDPQGNLILHGTSGDVIEQAPVVYQEGNGVRQTVTGRYVLEGEGTVGFAVGAYDRSRPLVIDPVLSYSTYLGGTDFDTANAIAVDGSGSVYVAGSTNSTDFPTANAFQSDSHAAAIPGDSEAFVAKLNPAGTALVYATYLGGTGFDAAYGVAVDGSGSAYVTGSTSSTDFPTTPNAFAAGNSGFTNAFVTRLNPAGDGLLYSTYFGGTQSDSASGIAVDGAGGAYITGTTTSANTFPTGAPPDIAPPAQSVYGGGTSDAFVARFDTNATIGFTSLVYSSYLGGEGQDAGNAIAIDSAGDAYVTGFTYSTSFPTVNALQSTLQGSLDAFASKLNPQGSLLLYSTYLGGSDFDMGRGIAVDGTGHAFVVGNTSSTDFPTANALQPSHGGASLNDDAFVTQLDPAQSGPASLVASTYLGGAADEAATAVALDAAGDVYVTGNTNSVDFPTANALQPALDTSGGSIEGFNPDAFVSVINPSDSAFLYSTYLGGDGSDSADGIAVDSTGGAYLAGQTGSSTFPTANALQPNLNTSASATTDAFVSKLAFAAPTITGLSPASQAEGAAAFTLTVTGTGFVNTSVVRFNGMDLPTTFQGPTQLRATVSGPVEEGNAAITVFNPTPGEGISAPAILTISDAVLTDTTVAATLSAVEGQDTGNQVVATFIDANAAATATDFAGTTIDWGDGQTTAGTVQLVGPAAGGLAFQVLGAHTYADEGMFRVTVSVRDVGGQSLTASSTQFGVGDAGLTNTTAAAALTAVEGQDTATQVVGTFTDANPGATVADFTTTINWGDGQTSSGTVQAVGPTTGGMAFQVVGNHTYAEEGSDSVTATIRDIGGQSVTATGTTFKVADATLIDVTTAQTLTSIEGQSIGNQLVASFLDRNPGATTADFANTTIDWGDGTTTTATVTAAPAGNPAGSFAVAGSHVYAEEGAYRVQISIRDSGGQGLTIGETAAIADAPLTRAAVSPPSTPASAGVGTGEQVLLSFSDGNPLAPVSDYDRVLIDWGDGTTTGGAVHPQAGTPGLFNVVGQHTYTAAGTFPTLVTVHDRGGQTVTNQGGGGQPGAATGTQFHVPGLVPGQLTAVLSGPQPTFTVFAVTADHALWRHDDATGWTPIGAPGTILAIAVAPEESLNPVVFAVTSARGLARFEPQLGWQSLGAAGTIRAVSAGRSLDGKADAFVLTTSGDLVEFHSSGWLPNPIGGRGTILSMSAVTQGRLYVVGADGSVLEHDDELGWLKLTSPRFAATLDTVDDGAGHVTVLAVRPDGSLWRHDDPTGWAMVSGTGTIQSATGGQDPQGQPNAFALTTSGMLVEFAGGRSQTLAGAGVVRSAAGVSIGRVYVIEADGSIQSHDDLFGWLPLAGPGFADGQ